MAFKQDLREMLSSDGKLSSKRIITFIAFICIVIAFFANLVLLVVMNVTILEGMITIVFAGLGVTVGEHILKKRTGQFRGGNEHYRDDDDYGYRDDYNHPNNNRNCDTDDTRYQGRDNHHHNVDTQYDENLGDN